MYLLGAVIDPQIHLLVFDTAPEALEEHVIAPRAPAVHADRNLVLDQDVGEGVTRKLAALASSNASMQNAASIVIDTRHDRTRRQPVRALRPSWWTCGSRQVDALQSRSALLPTFAMPPISSRAPLASGTSG